MKLMAVVDVGDRGVSIIRKGEIFESVGKVIDNMVTIRLKNDVLYTINNCLFIQVGK